MNFLISFAIFRIHFLNNNGFYFYRRHLHINTSCHPDSNTSNSSLTSCLTAPGQALAGSMVTLNCSSNVVGSFVWSHSNISDLSSAAGVAISHQDASGVFRVLTISSVLISHAGTYSCEVASAAGQSSTQSSNLRIQCELLLAIIWIPDILLC